MWAHIRAATEVEHSQPRRTDGGRKRGVNGGYILHINLHRAVIHYAALGGQGETIGGAVLLLGTFAWLFLSTSDSSALSPPNVMSSHLESPGHSPCSLGLCWLVWHRPPLACVHLPFVLRFAAMNATVPKRDIRDDLSRPNVMQQGSLQQQLSRSDTSGRRDSRCASRPARSVRLDLTLAYVSPRK